LSAWRVKKRACLDVISRLTFLIFLAAWVAQAQPVRPDRPSIFRPPVSSRPRVIIVEDPRAVVAFSPIPGVVEQMVDRALTTIAAKDGIKAAWSTFVSPQETVGIKVYSAPGAISGTRPCVVAAVVKGLLAAGIPPTHIVIWDKHRADLVLAGFDRLADQLGVNIAGSAEEGYEESKFYDSAMLGKLVWGDLEFGKKGENIGRKSYVSKLLTRRLTKIINITPLLNHNIAQVSGNLYSLAFGSVDNTLRFETAPNPYAQLAQAVPEIYVLPELGDRVVLNIVDALICQYQGDVGTLLQYSTMLNQIRVSTDPVALDVLSIHELDHQRQRARLPPVRLSWQIYTNASLLDLGVSDIHALEIIKVDSARREESSLRSQTMTAP
jgi:hypothetical protein